MAGTFLRAPLDLVLETYLQKQIQDWLVSPKAVGDASKQVNVSNPTA